MRYLSTLLFLCLISLSAKAQPQWDYPRYPSIEYDFLKLELKLEIDPSENVVKGHAVYSAIANISDLTTMILNTRESSIESVSTGSEDLQHEIRNDSLIINLNDTLKRGDEVRIEITWQSETVFGYHNDGSVMWTSTVPKSHHHWLPGFDHPRNDLIVEATYSIPEEMTVIGNGDLISDEIIVGEGRKEITWHTEKEIPFTGISWIAGVFSIEEIRYGIKKIRYYSPHTDSLVDVSSILAEADKHLSNFENLLNIEYPYSSLNLISLEENYGDMISLRASQIPLYEIISTGNEMKSRILDQWFGINRRGETQWDYEKFIKPYQRFITLQYPEESDTYADRFEEGSTKLKLDVIGDILLDEDHSVLTPVALYERIYNKYGQRVFGTPVELMNYGPGLSDVFMNPFEDMYLIEFSFNQPEGELKLFFNSTNDENDSLHTATLTQYSFSDTLSSEVTFTGALDSVSIEVSPSLEYAILDISDRSLNVLENKPLEFWLAQLRAEDPELRAQAAYGLLAYKDQPDIQLALNDILSFEEDPFVLSAIYSILSEITAGAIGTEQTYLRILNSDSQSLQLAAIRALSKFDGNDEVVYALRNKVLRASNEEIEVEAFDAFLNVSDSLTAVALVDRLINLREDEIAIMNYIEKSRTVISDSAITERLFPFLSDEYSTQVRLNALERIQRTSAEINWDIFVPDMIRDSNVLIREKGASLVNKLSDELKAELINEIQSNEFDFRVFEALCDDSDQCEQLFDIKKADS